SLQFYLFFFSLTRPQQRSTLFPYTTLFRSNSLKEEPSLPRKLEDRVLGVCCASVAIRETDCASVWGQATTSTEFVAAINLYLQQDRKSTRLNSSHDQISYAVFCLKKKKNKE